MGIFDKFKKETRDLRFSEQVLYEQVAEELNNGIRKEGLWFKAIEKSDGFEEKVKPLYIKYRVASLKDEIEHEYEVMENIRQKKYQTSLNEEHLREVDKERKERFEDVEDDNFFGILFLSLLLIGFAAVFIIGASASI